MVGERAPGLTRVHAAAFHRVGSVEAEVREHGGRHVDEVHETVVLRRGRAQQARSDARSAERGDAERGALLRWCRPHDQHHVAVVDVSEQPPDDAVGVLERAGAHLHRLLVGRELRLDVGAHEVGTLDQNDRARLPRVLERTLHPVGVEAHPERRGGVLAQQPVVDPTAGDLARARHQRGDRGAPPRRRPRVGSARVGAVTVGDHRARDAGVRQLVTEATGLGAEELLVVGLDGFGDRHVHEPVAGREPGAGGEHDTGAVAAEVLVDAESLVAGGAVAERARTGTDGHVAARQPGRSVDAVGDHRAHGRLREQPVEVRGGRLLEVGPLGVGQRHDEDATLTGCGGRRRGRCGEGRQRHDADRSRTRRAATAARVRGPR